MTHPSTFLVTAAKHAVRCSHDVPAGQVQPIIDDWNYGVVLHIPGHARLPSPPSPTTIPDAITPHAEPNGITRGAVVATATGMRWPLLVRRGDDNDILCTRALLG